MRNFLRSLIQLQELIIVMTIAFGYSIYLSNVQFIKRFVIDSSDRVSYYYSNFSYLSMLFFELIIIGILALFLETRMWRISDFSLKMSWKAIGAGILLLFVNNLILYLSLNIPFLSKASEQVTSIEFASGIVPNLPLMILTAVVINPFFEEIFLIGYLGKWFKNHSPLIFIITSTLIRMSYHTYQGVLGIYSVTVAGLLFTLYYLKYRNTVPIIVTHALYNLSYYLRNYYFEE